MLKLKSRAEHSGLIELAKHIKKKCLKHTWANFHYNIIYSTNIKCTFQTWCGKKLISEDQK